jgi:hypothetical protein
MHASAIPCREMNWAAVQPMERGKPTLPPSSEAWIPCARRAWMTARLLVEHRRMPSAGARLTVEDGEYDRGQEAPKCHEGIRPIF